MPEQFVVPQFIDVEDKIIGPITVRQFIIILVDFGLVFICYKLFDFTLFIVAGIPLFIFGIVVAFVKINGQSFHYFLLNFIQTIRRPRIRIWNKNLIDAELKLLILPQKTITTTEIQHKPRASTSRLAELSLVVNTGGVYKPDEE